MPTKRTSSARLQRIRTAGRHHLSTQLREAIRSDGRSCYAIAQAAGTSASVVGRFFSGERDVYLETADALASALGLRLISSKRGPRPSAHEADGPRSDGSPASR